MQSPDTMTYKGLELVWDEIGKQEAPSIILVNQEYYDFIYSLWKPWIQWVKTKGKRGEKPPKGWGLNVES